MDFEKDKMNYDKLLDFAVELSARLQKSGAETYRVEETISRILTAYGTEAEASVIPNNINATCKSPDGQYHTIVRRIHSCDTLLDGIEKYSALSREICAKTPELDEAWDMLNATTASIRRYNWFFTFLGYFLIGFGFGFFFSGTLMDSIIAGVAGIAVGLCQRFMNNLHANTFFTTLICGFVLAFISHCSAHLGICRNADIASIGAIMILVPGFLFTNSIRDIIYGDTMSGVNRLIQVLIIAAALVVGTSVAVSLARLIFGSVEPAARLVSYPVIFQCIAGCIGALGFCLLFNIHGHGIPLCLIGAFFSWLVYCICAHYGTSEYLCYFFAAAFSSLYAEIMARIRKYPATSYLMASLVPLIPGSGVYYTVNAVANGDVSLFWEKGVSTVAIAGAMALAILLISTLFRMWKVYIARRMSRAKNK